MCCQKKLSYHQGLGVSQMKRHIISDCQEFPSDIDRNAIFPVSGPVGDARGFVVDNPVHNLVRNHANHQTNPHQTMQGVQHGFFGFWVQTREY
jgi:hypothetical protein